MCGGAKEKMTTENMYKIVVIVGLTMRLSLQPVIRRRRKDALFCTTYGKAD